MVWELLIPLFSPSTIASIDIRKKTFDKERKNLAVKATNILHFSWLKFRSNKSYQPGVEKLTWATWPILGDTNVAQKTNSVQSLGDNRSGRGLPVQLDVQTAGEEEELAAQPVVHPRKSRFVHLLTQQELSRRSRWRPWPTSTSCPRVFGCSVTLTARKSFSYTWRMQED